MSRFLVSVVPAGCLASLSVCASKYTLNKLIGPRFCTGGKLAAIAMQIDIGSCQQTTTFNIALRFLFIPTAMARVTDAIF